MKHSHVTLANNETSHDVVVVLGANENVKKVTVGQRLEHITRTCVLAYSVKAPNQIACSFTATVAGSTLTVTAVASGTLFLGSVISGSTIHPGTIISAYGTGVGGTGTYTLAYPQTAIAVATALTAIGPGNLVNDSFFLEFVGKELVVDASTNSNGMGVCLLIDNPMITHVEHSLPRVISSGNQGRLSDFLIKVKNADGTPATFASLTLVLSFVMQDVQWDRRQPGRDDAVTPNFPSMAYDTRMKFGFN